MRWVLPAAPYRRQPGSTGQQRPAPRHDSQSPAGRGSSGAAGLAGRFTAAWGTWSWQQAPAAWLARLRPMAAASLEPALAQAAGDRGVLAQRTAARQNATATVTALAISDLTPGSVTLTVTARQVITTRTSTSRASASWAVTLTPDGSGWLVWDIEPAAAGNS
jgi:hypothetical protein